jgi:outer membrane murein-binding lipoprotein Lpp
MGKLDLIKARLASLLVEVEMSTVKTDKAVLEYDGELAEGVAVFVTDAETEERVPAADGEYITEDNKVITVAEGKVVSIVEKEEEVVEEPTEEPQAEEEVVAEEEPIVEEPIVEEPKVEEPSELEAKVAELETALEDLKAKYDELVKKVEGMAEETQAQLEKMSAAKPAAEEFENTKTVKKTGNAKVDRFIERYGDK